VLRIDRSASSVTAASPDRCRAVLTDVPAYPTWASLIERVEATGPGDAITVTGKILGLEIVMLCVVEEDSGAIRLRRLPFDAGDDERYLATWTLEPDGRGTRIGLHVTAELDAPGAASLLRGRVERKLADELLADLVRAVR